LRAQNDVVSAWAKVGVFRRGRVWYLHYYEGGPTPPAKGRFQTGNQARQMAARSTANWKMGAPAALEALSRFSIPETAGAGGLTTMKTSAARLSRPSAANRAGPTQHLIQFPPETFPPCPAGVRTSAPGMRRSSSVYLRFDQVAPKWHPKARKTGLLRGQAGSSSSWRTLMWFHHINTFFCGRQVGYVAVQHDFLRDFWVGACWTPHNFSPYRVSPGNSMSPGFLRPRLLFAFAPPLTSHFHKCFWPSSPDRPPHTRWSCWRDT